MVVEHMTDFTPGPAALGGLLIGIAAVLLMATTGRIAGISGYLSRLLPPYSDTLFIERLAFIAGIVLAPVAYTIATGVDVTATVTGNIAVLMTAGLLVGVGTVLGSGCTSGHGVCGLARLSKRSLAATATFMAVAGATVFVVRHAMGG